eukprot:snap_masked-scaffold_2-processed-gene-22.13-mRNA-1 protein AED:1.00 eAED:1.00 QI:0/-1/0/0/-1/1/1/0/350
METSSVRLKGSCERCSRLKRQCDSKKPSCSRCCKFKAECVYKPVKKRKKKTVSNLVPKPKYKKMNFSEAETELLTCFLKDESLSLFKAGKEYEDIEAAWNIFEWFVSKVSYPNLVSYSAETGNKALHFILGNIFTLQSFIKSLTFMDKERKEFEGKLNKLLTIEGFELSELIKIYVDQLNFDEINELFEGCSEKKIITNFPFVSAIKKRHAFCKTCVKCIDYWDFPNFNFTFEVNDFFEKMFGYSKQNITEDVLYTPSCILPFGSSVISRIAKEENIKQYLESNLFQYAKTCPDGEQRYVPYTLEFPNSIIMELNTADEGVQRFQIWVEYYESIDRMNFCQQTKLYFVAL